MAACEINLVYYNMIYCGAKLFIGVDKLMSSRFGLINLTNIVRSNLLYYSNLMRIYFYELSWLHIILKTSNTYREQFPSISFFYCDCELILIL